MNSTVVSGLLTVTLKLSVVFFGFFFVPAFVGETVAVNVDSGVLSDGAARRGRAWRTRRPRP